MRDREYRVRWRRDGGYLYRIYQTESAARRKAEGILALEAVKSGTTFSGMPDLVDEPIIQSRPVGPWGAGGTVATPTGDALDRMRTWAGPPEDHPYDF